MEGGDGKWLCTYLHLVEVRANVSLLKLLIGLHSIDPTSSVCRPSDFTSEQRGQFQK